MRRSAKYIISELSISRQTLWRWRQQGLVPEGRLDRSGRLCFSEAEAAEIRRFADSYKPPKSKQGPYSPQTHRIAEKLPSGGSAVAGGVYLDANATTPLLPEVIHQIERVLRAQPGNASSSHSGGEYCRVLLAAARSAVEALIEAPPDSVVFTSGGTEANNLALSGAINTKRRRVLISSTEHSSIENAQHLASRYGATVSAVRVAPTGVVDLDDLELQLAGGAALVSIHWVNPETGVIQPIEEIARIVHDHQGLLHVDAAQACGKMRIHVQRLPIDLMTVVGHKLHAPPGIGALYVRRGVRLNPLFAGGDQEMGLRPGTENVLGIVGFGAAAALRAKKLAFLIQEMAALRDKFEERVLATIPKVHVNGGADDVERICNTSNLRFDGVDGQALVARLDQRGIQCSQSSACTSRRPEPSHVLLAMGLTEEQAYSSVRFSFSELNSLEEIDTVVNHLAELCQELRGYQRNLAAKYAD